MLYLFLIIYQFMAFGSIPNFLNMVVVNMSSKYLFAGFLLAGLLSANIANLLNQFKPESEVIWIMLNYLPIVLTSLALCMRKTSR